jgi:hypothetical protein
MQHFILGAPDPEMHEIKRVLASQGIGFAHATIRSTEVRIPRPGEDWQGARRTRMHRGIVQAHQAYRADGTEAPLPADAELVFVECAVAGLTGRIVDHHNEGDPGYGLPPERYLEGSSLGQTLALLGLAPTQEQRIIAAADHCLAHAYAGRCPGVSPEELGRWRVHSRAQAQGVPVDELERRIRAAQEALVTAPRIELAGTQVAWFEQTPAEISEASGRTGIPFAYVRRESDGRVKAGIMSAPPEAIETWMRRCGLHDVYGDPQRGFAGGYFSVSSL